MSCYSCGLGASKTKRSYSKAKVETVTYSKPHPSKGIIPNSKKKASVPTRSPARTFNTVGDTN